MNIQCNDRRVTLAARTLETAMSELGYRHLRVAAALNGAFVPKSRWGETELREGDRLEILSPMQ